MSHKALYPYQQQGVDRLVELLTARGSALLADPPGAGKSPQAVRAALALDCQSLLVLCPASLRLNWARELVAWGWPTEPKVLLSTKGVQDCRERQMPLAMVCSYDLAARDVVKAALLAFGAGRWDALVLDESHYLKSAESQRTRAVLIDLWSAARYRLAITGTPVPNGRAVEAWPLFARMAPELFTPWSRYEERYCVRMETDYGVTYPRSRNLDELGRLARAHFMVRRSREECMADLPPLVRQVVPLEVSTAAVAEFEAGLNEVSPELFASVLKAVEAGVGIVQMDGLSYARARLGEIKAPAAASFIKDLLPQGPLVVFAHHRAVLSTLFGALSEHAEVVVVTGDTPVGERQAAVDAFQEGRAEVFLASITAASTGLTLTRSSTVVFVEADWVPSTNEQAEGRVLRRTQAAATCRAFYLVVPDSLDERVLATVLRKQKDISRLLGESAGQSRESLSGLSAAYAVEAAAEGFTVYAGSGSPAGKT